MVTLCRDSAELREYSQAYWLSHLPQVRQGMQVYTQWCKGSVRNNYNKHIVKKLCCFLTMEKLLDFWYLFFIYIYMFELLKTKE